MCFSAPVSFVSSGVLAGLGLGALKKNRTRAEWPLALIPMGFAVQQFFEGMLWLLPKSSVWASIFAYGFLFFAFLVWPLLFPGAAFLVENNPVRKWWISVCFWIGVGVFINLLLALFALPLEVFVDNNRLVYHIDLPFQSWGSFAYAFVVCGGFLLSSHRYIFLVGLLTLVSFFVSLWMYYHAFTSVWCFFAAILSGILFFHFLFTRKHERTNL